jgi:4-hydroxybenzoyl-CoA thioesterase
MLLKHTHVVRFAEVDPAGILYFARVAEHCHAAYEAFVAACGLPPEQYFAGRWKAPIVRWEVDYAAPSRFGETLEVRIEEVRLGGASVRFHFEVRGPDGSVRSKARMVAVFVEGEPARAARVPDEVAEAFRRLGATEA